ncbi:MAG TPA: AAA family ATPase [Polyangiales bacterium]|nr:AAA family ATPase [Polyangiales bacterium]
MSLLHSRKLVHRDVSPRNVRCTRSGRAKLIDFGAMVPMGSGFESVGTPSFVAPEVLRHGMLDARTDLFSLGATLYFALTGKKPFAARSLADLHDAWREPPAPPSHFASDVPEALDQLVLSLLSLEPARRPASAFEVLQRSAVIAELRLLEPEDVAQVYFSAPALIGRETEQRRFRQQLRRAGQSHGGSLIFEGAAGSGRSRLLETCEIEAKLAGATVVSVPGRSAGGLPLSAAYAVAEQVLWQLPESAEASAFAAGVEGTLLLAPRRLRPLDELLLDRYRSGAALSHWLLALCSRHTLVLVLDDVERIDGASLAWLSALAHDALELRLLIVVSLPSGAAGAGQGALALLRAHAQSQTLSPLSAAQTEALFSSIFHDAPHSALVSDRIQRVALGNPRASLALALDLVERRLIRYAGGGWSLPAQLAVTELPTSVEAAVRQRIAALWPLARGLVESQALAFEGPWSLADYAAISGADSQQLQQALQALVRQGVLVDLGSRYTLGGLGVRECLLEGLSAADRARHHVSLSAWCARMGRPIVLEVHHLFGAGASTRALDRLAEVLEAAPNATSLLDRTGIDRKSLVSILDQAHAHASAEQRPLRELAELTRRLLELSTTTDESLFARYAPAWLARLEHDSGLDEYRSTGIALPEAMRAAQARFESTEVAQRGYRAEEALKLLGHYVSLAVAIAARTADTRLYTQLAGQLEQLAGVSPMLDVMRGLALASYELNCAGQPERAHERMQRVYAGLLARRDLPYIDTVRVGAAQAVAVAEVALGLASAEDWLQLVGDDPLHRLGTVHLRRVLCIVDGDSAGAALHRKQADLLAIQTDGLGLIPARLPLELSAYLFARDLAGVKYVTDRLEHMAHKAPGWQSMHLFALGAFQRLRGDLAAAEQALERALAAADPARLDPPPNLNAWMSASAEYVAVLTELGSAQQALERGLALRARAEQLSLPISPALERALAQAETELGEYSAAASRLDALVARAAGLRPSLAAADYESRARVAIAARDAAAAERFIQLTREPNGTAPTADTSARYGRLLDEARRAELQLAFAAAPRPSKQPALAGFASIETAEARSRWALQLLLEATGARTGHLYYARPGELSCSARTSTQADPALDAFVQGYLRLLLESAAMTTIFTDMNDPIDRIGTWTDPHGTVHQLALLSCEGDDACVGLVALSGTSKVPWPEEFWPLTAALSAQLLTLGDAQPF